MLAFNQQSNSRIITPAKAQSFFLSLYQTLIKTFCHFLLKNFLVFYGKQSVMKSNERLLPKNI